MGDNSDGVLDLTHLSTDNNSTLLYETDSNPDMLSVHTTPGKPRVRQPQRSSPRIRDRRGTKVDVASLSPTSSPASGLNSPQTGGVASSASRRTLPRTPKLTSAPEDEGYETKYVKPVPQRFSRAAGGKDGGGGGGGSFGSPLLVSSSQGSGDSDEAEGESSPGTGGSSEGGGGKGKEPERRNAGPEGLSREVIVEKLRSIFSAHRTAWNKRQEKKKSLTGEGDDGDDEGTEAEALEQASIAWEAGLVEKASKDKTKKEHTAAANRARDKAKEHIPLQRDGRRPRVEPDHGLAALEGKGRIGGARRGTSSNDGGQGMRQYEAERQQQHQQQWQQRQPQPQPSPFYAPTGAFPPAHWAASGVAPAGMPGPSVGVHSTMWPGTAGGGGAAVGMAQGGVGMSAAGGASHGHSFAAPREGKTGISEAQEVRGGASSSLPGVSGADPPPSAPSTRPPNCQCGQAARRVGPVTADGAANGTISWMCAKADRNQQCNFFELISRPGGGTTSTGRNNSGMGGGGTLSRGGTDGRSVGGYAAPTQSSRHRAADVFQVRPGRSRGNSER
ncbi:unnamed protein product [Ectocarpus sp. CCAP 1310/34]|nr:unnamed protein product [Ectocarpus sp. CCAP 1310/34]